MDKNTDHIQSPEKDLISDYMETRQTEAWTTYDIKSLVEDIDVATEDIIASAWGPVSISRQKGQGEVNRRGKREES